MLDEIFIKKAAREALSKYSLEHGGNMGLTKADIIRIVMQYGGDMEDVHGVMVECIRNIAPDMLHEE